MRIVSVSRRTDIPAFYSRWFLNRIQAGFCHWINPFGGQVQRVSLRPQDCLALVFWTRNPKPLLPHLAALRELGFRFYFHFTINGYPRLLESNSPPLAEAISAFRRLSDVISPALTFWRYDPILLSEATSEAYHQQQFEALARQLEGYTQRCYFSFVDRYGKTARNLAQVERASSLTFREPTIEERLSLVRALGSIASDHGIQLYSCCEDELLAVGVQKAHCIDLGLIQSLWPNLDVRVKVAPTRADCGCVEAADIGAYDTCVYGCAYCYATNSRRAALQRLRDHDPDDTSLWRPATLHGVDLASVEQVRPSRPPGSDERAFYVLKQACLFEDAKGTVTGDSSRNFPANRAGIKARSERAKSPRETETTVGI